MLLRALVFFLLLIAKAIPVSAADGVPFLEGDLETVKRQAVAEGKMLFVHFTADWCLPCRWMEKETYPDKALSDYIEEHFLALRVDIDAPRGLRAKRDYQVVLLPSMLVFDRQGRLSARFEESLTAGQLLDKLRTVEAAPARPAPFTQAPPATPAVVANPFPDAAPAPSSDPLLHPSDPVIAPAAEAEAAPVAEPEDAQQPGFAVQLGVFRQFENAQREADRLSGILEQAVRVRPDNLDGNAVFRITLGHFPDAESAETFRRRLAYDHNIKGVVKVLPAE